MRAALDWTRLWPFVVGAALGVPAGVSVLTWADPRSIRIAVGIILILYSLYAFFRQALNLGAVPRMADGAVGFANGVLGGLTGLAGIIVTIWCILRGWPKEAQRATFQPRAGNVTRSSDLPARQSSTLPTSGMWKRSHGYTTKLPCRSDAGYGSSGPITDSCNAAMAERHSISSSARTRIAGLSGQNGEPRRPLASASC